MACTVPKSPVLTAAAIWATFSTMHQTSQLASATALIQSRWTLNPVADLSLKKKTPTKLLWLDLEMTGLNPTKDRILEVGAVITDWNFAELDVFESGVGQSATEIMPLLDANDLYSALPENKAAMLKLAANSPAEKEVEAQVVALA